MYVHASLIPANTALKSARFPCVLPFSQMYPLCCIDIRNFLNQFYFFSDDHFQHPNVIDSTLKTVLTLPSIPPQAQLTLPVTRRAPLLQSLLLPRRASLIPISRPNSANPHQPRTFRNCLLRIRTTSHRRAFLYFSWWTHHSERYRRIQKQQEDGREKDFRASKFKDR